MTAAGAAGSFHAFVGTMLHAAAAGEPLPVMNLDELSNEKLLWLLAHALAEHGLADQLPGRIAATLRDRCEEGTAGRARMPP